MSNDLTALFTATEVGEHLIDIRVKNQRIAGSPFRTHAYNPRAIKVGRIPNGIINEPVEFESKYILRENPVISIHFTVHPLTPQFFLFYSRRIRCRLW